MEAQHGTSARLRITVYPRLHLTLLAMHKGEYRANGGIGFAVSAPSCELVFSSAKNFDIDDRRSDALTAIEQESLAAVLKEEQERCGFTVAIEAAIGGEMRTHFGFGSGTAIRLACLEALHQLNNSTPSPAELVAASKRGGTSGIGIHTYFSGGCVFDLGKPSGNELHVPSNQVVVPYAPLLMDCLPMPEWGIGICIPRNIPHKTQAEEQAFFRRTCPLPAEAAYETVYHALFGLYAAIREADRTAFCVALRAIQDCAWKKAERLEYGVALAEVEQALYKCGADAVGMSSFGPSLFFLADDVANVVSCMRLEYPDCDCFDTRPANSGRTLHNA